MENLSVKIGLYAELLGITFLLMLPFSKYGRYSRKTLEEQIIGTNYLLNGGMQIPIEAKREYRKSGDLILIVGIFIAIQQVTNIIGIILGVSH